MKKVNLEIPKGKNVAIVGESGSGKSTLVKLILRLLSPDSGTIKIGEKKLELLNTDVWRNSCCILMQESVIFDGSVRYNITLEDDENEVDREFLEQIIQMCALEEIINGLPEGMKTLLGSSGTSLSRGQSQRVLLARTVYKRAPYLIMDEPTSALDAVTAFDVFENIKAYYEDQTIILITHKINIARQMDVIFVMDDGEIVEQGSHEQLMANEGKYHQLATIK
ncbi:MAG: ATP-binding cassette domain-containing protein [Bacteroidota bacterium]